jgi:glycosyltransferase involved in cell wall biosynthesis
MKVLVNALSAVIGGGQTYLLNLLRHLPDDPSLRVAVLAPDALGWGGVPGWVDRIPGPPRARSPLYRAAWERLQLARLARRSGARVLFSPGGLLPADLPRRLSTVVTFQNMLPFDPVQRRRYPLGYRRVRHEMLRRGLSSSMRRASLVLFISQFARDAVFEALGPLPGAWAVVPHGLDDRFRTAGAAGESLERPAWIPAGPYYLYVSWLDYYKAQLEVIEGFAIFCRRGGAGRLLLVGPEYRAYGDLVRARVASLGLGDRILVPGPTQHEELPALYRHAAVNLFGSLTENCPNILFEMLAAGRPCLVSDRPPMPEFAGAAVDYFDPSSPEAFASGLARLLADPARQAELSSRGPPAVAARTWQTAAGDTWRAIRALGKGSWA